MLPLPFSDLELAASHPSRWARCSRTGRTVLWTLLTATLTGCHGLTGPPEPTPLVSHYESPGTPQPAPATAAGIPNPLTVSAQDPEFVWNQLVDTVDDYFTISNERRVQNIGGLLTEGQIETRYQPGATWLEPWHWDSTTPESRSLATFQSIRRGATVRVVPVAGQYQVFVQVVQDLEDANRPVLATPGSATPQFEGFLARFLDRPETAPVTLGWIPIGRDTALEQEILRDLQGRLAVSAGDLN